MPSDVESKEVTMLKHMTSAGATEPATGRTGTEAIPGAGCDSFVALGSARFVLAA